MKDYIRKIITKAGFIPTHHRYIFRRPETSEVLFYQHDTNCLIIKESSITRLILNPKYYSSQQLYDILKNKPINKVSTNS